MTQPLGSDDPLLSEETRSWFGATGDDGALGRVLPWARVVTCLVTTLLTVHSRGAAGLMIGDAGWLVLHRRTDGPGPIWLSVASS